MISPWGMRGKGMGSAIVSGCRNRPDALNSAYFVCLRRFFVDDAISSLAFG
jgi:hypothetical protein